MEKPTGCAKCRQTNVQLNQYSFHNILGQEYVLFVCIDCIAGFSRELAQMTTAEQSTYLTALGTIIKRG